MVLPLKRKYEKKILKEKQTHGHFCAAQRVCFLFKVGQNCLYLCKQARSGFARIGKLWEIVCGIIVPFYNSRAVLGDANIPTYIPYLRYDQSSFFDKRFNLFHIR